MNSIYPEPVQLRQFAKEPMPFHDVYLDDFEFEIDDEANITLRIRTDGQDVQYVYRPSYIRVEPEDPDKEATTIRPNADQYVHINDVALDMQIEEDFICQTAFSEIGDHEGQLEAFWLLNKVIITVTSDD